MPCLDSTWVNVLLRSGESLSLNKTAYTYSFVQSHTLQTIQLRFDRFEVDKSAAREQLLKGWPNKLILYAILVVTRRYLVKDPGDFRWYGNRV